MSLKATLEILSNGIKNKRRKEWQNVKGGKGSGSVSIKRGIIYFIHLGSSDIKETQTIWASPHATLRPIRSASNRLSSIDYYPHYSHTSRRLPQDGAGDGGAAKLLHL